MGSRRPLLLENVLYSVAFCAFGLFVWASDKGHTSVHLITRRTTVTLGALENVLLSPPQAGEGSVPHQQGSHELIHELAGAQGLAVSLTALLEVSCFAGAVGAVTKCYALYTNVERGSDAWYLIELVESAVVQSSLVAAIYVLFGGLEEVSFVLLLVLSATAEFCGLTCETLLARGTAHKGVNGTLSLSLYVLLRALVAGLTFSGIATLERYEHLHHFNVMATYIVYTAMYGLFTFSRTVSSWRGAHDLASTYVVAGRTAIMFAFRTSQIWQLWALITSALMRAQMLTAPARAGAAQPSNVSFIMTVIPFSLCTLYLFSSFPGGQQPVKKAADTAFAVTGAPAQHAVAIFSQRARCRDGNERSPCEHEGTSAPYPHVVDQKRAKKTRANTYKISFNV